MSVQLAGNQQERDDQGRFAPGQSGNPQGRKKGSKNKATKLREVLMRPILPEAIEKLSEAVKSGERWAIELTIGYCLAKPKPVDTEEISEIEERLGHLEEIARRRR